MTETVLVSWRDGTAKRAILDFIKGATTQGGADFVAPADRIAAFDNDGTLWVEQPLPPQFDFVFGRWAQEIKKDPALAAQQPYKAIFERDPAFFQGVATQEPAVIDTLLKAFARTWAHHTGGVRGPGPGLARGRQATQARGVLPGPGLQADAGAFRPVEGQRVPGVRLLGRWPGFHAGVRRGDLGRVPGKRDRLRRRVRLCRR